MERKKYESPEINVDTLIFEDSIAASTGAGLNEDIWGEI